MVRELYCVLGDKDRNRRKVSYVTGVVCTSLTLLHDIENESVVVYDLPVIQKPWNAYTFLCTEVVQYLKSNNALFSTRVQSLQLDEITWKSRMESYEMLHNLRKLTIQRMYQYFRERGWTFVRLRLYGDGHLASVYAATWTTSIVRCGMCTKKKTWMCCSWGCSERCPEWPCCCASSGNSRTGRIGATSAYGSPSIISMHKEYRCSRSSVWRRLSRVWRRCARS